MTKNLIAYFSFSGNTRTVANMIQSKVGGDIFEIETKAPYPSDYDETAYGIAKEQHDNNIKPELKSSIDIKPYEVIFIGTPAWWYDMAPAVKTFLTENNFENKTIIPFITHGGGGKYTIAEDIAEITHANVLQPLVIYNNGGENVQFDIDIWLDMLNYQYQTIS